MAAAVYPGGVILGIDSSLGSATAVIEPDGVVVAETESLDPLRHAEAIGGLIDAVIAETPGGAGAIEAVAIGMGPGPFTGLRVGIAAGRAFALGRGIPVLPVVSHDAVALERMLRAAIAGEFDEPPFAVVTDARRREVAVSVYRGLDDDGLPVRESGPALYAREGIDERLAALGLDGTDPDGQRIERTDASRIPAAMLALVAARARDAGRTLPSGEPLYLRTPDVSPPSRTARLVP